MGHSVSEAEANSLLLRATSILRLGIIPSDSLTSAKSNSELVYSLRNLLQNSLTHDCPASLCHWTPSFSQEDGTTYIPAKGQSDAPDLSDTPREQLDITAKLFLLDSSADARSTTQVALHELEQSIGLKDVDLLILQSPGLHYEDDLGTPDEERALIAKEVARYNSIASLPGIGSLGVAEFSLPRLQAFLASDLKSKPTVNQVNLRECCSVTATLTDFINKHDIQLLVHSDLSNLLPDSTFLSLLDSFKQQLPNGLKDTYTRMKAKWVLKYSVLYKHRSVVADKGYIVFATV